MQTTVRDGKGRFSTYGIQNNNNGMETEGKKAKCLTTEANGSIRVSHAKQNAGFVFKGCLLPSRV